jgi:S-adenosylmethionine:tRNA ribosyltransferase-isomerase
MDPRDISIARFNYALPDDRIARFPLERRDASRLLVWTNGVIGEDTYAKLPAYLPSGTRLVFNNTRVVEARILLEREGGGKPLEVFCLEPSERYPDITTAMLQTTSVDWVCLLGGAKKWTPGQTRVKAIATPNGTAQLRLTLKGPQGDAYLMHFEWDKEGMSFAELLHHAGVIPLPPYLKRDSEASDKERYQTVYAEHDGSVAAPTAGLHFTPVLLDSLKAKGIERHFVTLHVGAGTFKPVKSETLGGHDMHAEYIDVSREQLKVLTSTATGPTVAVGTTSLRTLESLYWMGVKALQLPDAPLRALEVKQWDAYELPQEVGREEALHALLQRMDTEGAEKLVARTQLLITPAYRLRVCEGLITNFHQPQSTLLLLISAFVGDEWQTIYRYALDTGFRFLSYGDGSLLWKRGYSPV